MISPIGDVVVLAVHAQNVALDGVAAVVQQHDDWLLFLPQNRRQFLGGQLERPVPDEQQVARIRIRHLAAQQSWQGITNRAPNSTVDVAHILRHALRSQTNIGGSGLRNHRVTRANELANLRPQARLRQLGTGADLKWLRQYCLRVHAAGLLGCSVSRAVSGALSRAVSGGVSARASPVGSR